MAYGLRLLYPRMAVAYATFLVNSQSLPVRTLNGVSIHTDPSGGRKTCVFVYGNAVVLYICHNSICTCHVVCRNFESSRRLLRQIVLNRGRHLRDKVQFSPYSKGFQSVYQYMLGFQRAATP